MIHFFNFAIQTISFHHFVYTGLSNLDSSSKVLVPRGTYVGLNNIPVQGCSLAAAASMDSHEEGEWSTVWCYRHCSPSPPSLIPLLLAHPLDRGSLSWTATHRLLRRGFCDCECDSVLSLFLTARNTVQCLNLECPSHFCSAIASGFGPWSSVWGSNLL